MRMTKKQARWGIKAKNKSIFVKNAPSKWFFPCKKQYFHIYCGLIVGESGK